MVDDVSLTQNGVLAGTPEYMAPEQARGEPIDHRADLFSLGSVLYACCTGVPPFRGSTAVAVLLQVSNQAPKPIRTLNSDVPTWLEAFIGRLMAKNPADRFQSAAEVATLLEGYLAHLRQPEVAAPQLPSSPPSPMEKLLPRPRMSTRRWLVAAACLACLLGGLGVIGSRLLVFQQMPAVDPGKAAAGALPAEPLKPVEPRGGLVCLLVNKNSGRCLCPAEGAANPGARIVQGPTPDQAGLTERWRLLRTGDVYRLRNESNGLVLEIGSANRDPGVQAIQWHDQVRLKNQHWTFERDEDSYRLRVSHSQMVLGIGQGNLEPGGKAIQWKSVPGVPDQLWELLPAPGTPLSQERGRIQSVTADQDHSSVEPTASPSRRSRVWLVVAGLFGLGLAAAWCVWLCVQRRRNALPEAANHLAPDTTASQQPALVTFLCSVCGKKLKTRAELAGKKIRCPQCRQSVRAATE